MKTRYFIVCYTGSVKHGQVIGTKNFTTAGTFISKEITIRQIIDDERRFKMNDVIITNIMEITREDYMHWNLED